MLRQVALDMLPLGHVVGRAFSIPPKSARLVVLESLSKLDRFAPHRARKRVEDLVRDAGEVIRVSQDEWLVRGRMSTAYDRWRRSPDPKWAELVEFDAHMPRM